MSDFSASDRAEVRVLPPLVPAITLFVGALLEWLVPTNLILDWSAARLAGTAIVALSALIFGVWPIALFLRSGQNPHPSHPTPSIETRGPYRVSRNPMYLGFLGICIGLGIAFDNLWIILLSPAVPILLTALVIKPEERYLEQKFGEEYVAYRNRVRRWL